MKHYTTINFNQPYHNLWWTGYTQAYIGPDRVNHNKFIFKTTENHHAGPTFMLAPYIFLGPAVAPPDF